MTLKTRLQWLSQGSLSMIDYLEKKRQISDSLAENLTPVSSDDLITYFINGLDSSYNHFVYAFLKKSDTTSVMSCLV